MYRFQKAANDCLRVTHIKEDLDALVYGGTNGEVELVHEEELSEEVVFEYDLGIND